MTLQLVPFVCECVGGGLEVCTRVVGMTQPYCDLASLVTRDMSLRFAKILRTKEENAQAEKKFWKLLRQSFQELYLNK